MRSSLSSSFFFFNDPATTEIYTLSLHDALPISPRVHQRQPRAGAQLPHQGQRSEEHTSELQSRENLVCRLLLAKQKRRVSVRTRSSSQPPCPRLFPSAALQ